ncbi:MAG: hypothetical protein AB8I08_17310 [Sandaracinaceae bacterium]
MVEPMEARSLRCDGCGAPLPAPEGPRVVCTYCRRDLEIVEGGAQVRDQRRARGVTDRLLHLDGDDIGEARRTSARDMALEQWQDVEHTVWATEASASSSWGGSWSPNALVGRPKVFPRHGDLAGAWAPATRDSAVEWVEVAFGGAPVCARAIRVFETHLPGSTFAATVVEGDDEERVWQVRAEGLGGPSRVLEVQLDPPREVSRVRLYVDNSLGTSWSEIDAVGLVSVDPLPVSRRVAPWVLPKRPGGGGWLVALAVVALLLAIGVGVYVGVRPRGTEGDGLGDVTPLTDTRMMVWSVSRPGLSQAGVVWASDVRSFSSQYQTEANAAHQALGLPDVFPDVGDDRRAWAPGTPDAGAEAITVGFTDPVRASAVAVVETAGAGALAYVMDVTPGQEPVLLWRGRTGAVETSRVLSIELRSPRAISAVRIGLDTTRVFGWNEIDAVGLVPAGPGG